MSIPSTDSKRIKRLEGTDRFTVEALSAFKYPDNVLCNHCARDKCKFRSYAQRHSDTLELRVMSCADFMPALGFSVLGGLDLRIWNTIRVGGAWADRLQPGMKVAIIDTKNNVHLSTCKVETTVTGTLEEMVHLHAHNNHAIKHEMHTGKTDLSQAPERMMRILKNANGTNIASPERAASVIYLRAL